MKMLTLLITLMFAISANAAYVQPTIKGRADSTKKNLVNLEIPNHQVTQIGPTTFREENGNSDILKNGSFEALPDPKVSWTVSPPSPSLELSDVSDDKQAICFSPSAQALEVSQDSTLNATAFANNTLQGLARGRVKITGLTAGQKVYFSPRRAGAIVTSLQKEVTANGLWQPMEVPFTLGGTSNGVSVHSDGYGNITATKICVDGFKLETNVKVTGETGVVGPWTDGTCTTSWLANSTTSCKYRQNGQNLEVQYYVTTSGAPTAASLQVQLPNGFTADTSKLSVGSTYISEIGDCVASDGGAAYYACQAMLVSNLTVSLRSLNSASTYVNTSSSLNSTTPITFGAGDHVAFTVSVPVTQFAASTSTYLGTNGNTSWAPCGHTTSDFQGFGTVTNIETQCKREGDDLLMRGNFTSGTSTPVEARLNLKLNGQALTSFGTSKISSLQLAGYGVLSVSSSGQTVVLIEPSVSYVTFGIQSGTTAGATKLQGGQVLSSGQTYSFKDVRIPIATWENSNLMIAQLSGLEKCADSYECEDTYSGRFSAAAATLSVNIPGWTACSRTDAGDFSCTHKVGLFTTTPFCGVFSGQNPGATADVTIGTLLTESASGFTMKIESASNTEIDTVFRVICQKQSPDYIGKTAKAVASDQNVRTPGVLNVVTYAAKIGLAGVVAQEYGNLISGDCTLSSTSNFDCSIPVGTFVSAPICSCTTIVDLATVVTGSDRTCTIRQNTTSELDYVTNANSALTPYIVNISCTGVAP
jgi:hypothetical protein